MPQLDKRGVDGAEVDGQTAPKLRQLLRYRGYWYDGWDNSLGTTRGQGWKAPDNDCCSRQPYDIT